jgi:hypothetical protein
MGRDGNSILVRNHKIGARQIDASGGYRGVVFRIMDIQTHESHHIRIGRLEGPN